VDPNRSEPLEGRYANHLEVGHNAQDLVMDFGQVFEDEQPLMHTRIVTHPTFARQMVEVLRQSLDRHEKLHGREPGRRRKR